MRWLNSITDSTGMNLNKVWETVVDREAWHPAVHRIAESAQLSDSTELSTRGENNNSYRKLWKLVMGREA